MALPLAVEWLGSVPYAEGLALQERAVEARRRGECGDRLLLLEHPPVVTLGRSADRAHLLTSPETLRQRGVELYEASRGGDVTYHAPGQLVGYLICDLEALGCPDVHRYLRSLEALLIDSLELLGVPACAIPGMTGVFVDRARWPGESAGERKLASIGVGLRGWVSYHGFALNVTTDLEGFGCIVPCGLHDVEMSSLARELPSLDSALFERAREVVALQARRRFL